MSMLYQIRNLEKRRQRDEGYRLLVRKLDVPQGARLAITGPSGCGKSTTLDILGLILQPDSARQFEFCPEPTHIVKIMPIWKNKNQDELANLRVANMGYVLQTGDLLPFLNVKANILLTGRLAGLDAGIVRQRLMELAEQLGIDALLDAMPATLSVGERQRVAISRALLTRPRLILADEPTAALDPLHAGQVMDAFLNVVEKSGASLIVVTHNAQWARNAGLAELPFQLEKDGAGITAILDYSTREARQ